MRVLVLGLYSWYRLSRNHYLMAIWVVMILIGAVILGTSTDATNAAGKLPAVEMAIKIARICALLAAIWIGLTVLSRELDGFTARTLLTKPVSRLEVSVGLLLGGAAYLTLFLFAVSAEIYILARIRGIPVSFSLVFVLPTLLPPLFAIQALAQMLSLVFSKPVTGFLVLGLSLEDFWKLSYETLRAKESYEWIFGALSSASKVFYDLAPTYDRFIMSYQGFERLEFPPDRFLFHALACLVYVFACCVFSSILLSRKEI